MSKKDLLIELSELISRPVLTSQDWSRLAEIGRRATISNLMRRNLPHLHVKLVSEQSVEGCVLRLYITPLKDDFAVGLDERELSQLVQEVRLVGAYIDGLDDALPGDLEE